MDHQMDRIKMIFILDHQMYNSEDDRDEKITSHHMDKGLGFDETIITINVVYN